MVGVFVVVCGRVGECQCFAAPRGGLNVQLREACPLVSLSTIDMDTHTRTPTSLEAIAEQLRGDKLEL